MADQISIEGIDCRARIGVSAQERAEYQRLEVTVLLRYSMEAAIDTDSLEYSIDYETLVRSIQDEVAQIECSLLETMAGHVCDVVLRHPRVERAEVEVRKFPKSLQGEIGRVSVHVARQQVSRNS